MPVLTVVAGPNGSGKSTLTNILIQRGVSLGEYLNADDIARALDGPPGEVSLRAQQVVRDKREAALREGRDHAFETVMSHPSHIDYMAKAADWGFTVRLYFVATEDPVINLDRVANRVLHGGHAVPVERIINRYRRCLDNLVEAMKVAHHVEIFDNSSALSPIRRVAMSSKPSGQSVRFGLNKESLAAQPVWWSEIILKMELGDGFADD